MRDHARAARNLDTVAHLAYSTGSPYQPEPCRTSKTWPLVAEFLAQRMHFLTEEKRSKDTSYSVLLFLSQSYKAVISGLLARRVAQQNAAAAFELYMYGW
jgi:hypothetical protein